MKRGAWRRSQCAGPAERFLHATYRNSRAGADDGEGPAKFPPCGRQSLAAYCGRPCHEKARSFMGSWLCLCGCLNHGVSDVYVHSDESMP
jgi:hypothetical protein